MPSVMHYNQEIWIGGTPDNPVLDGLGIDSDVFPFRDRRSRLTDHGWNGAIQTISLNGKFYDNLLRNAQSLGNTSPFLLAYLRGKYFLGPKFFLKNFLGHIPFDPSFPYHACFSQPCQQSSICMPNYKSYHCYCPNPLALSGPFCTTPNSPPRVQNFIRLFGTDYANINFQEVDTSTSLSVNIKFKTNYPDGVIYFHAGDWQFFSLILYNGYLIFLTNDSKKQRLSKMQLNTGFWQNVNIEYHFEEDDAEPEPSTSSKQKIIENDSSKSSSTTSVTMTTPKVPSLSITKLKFTLNSQSDTIYTLNPSSKILKLANKRIKSKIRRSSQKYIYVLDGNFYVGGHEINKIDLYPEIYQRKFVGCLGVEIGAAGGLGHVEMVDFLEVESKSREIMQYCEEK